jgi:hypothetical protein
MNESTTSLSDTLWPRRLMLKTVAGIEREFLLRPIPLKDYDKAWAAFDDEFSLAAVASGVPRDQILELDPAEFERLISAIREINANGFFAWAARRAARIAEAARTNFEAMAALPPEIAREMLRDAISPSSSPKRSP